MHCLKNLLVAGLLAGPAAATTLTLNRRNVTASGNATAPMTATGYGSVFDVEVTIGGQSFLLLVDSGSSDTYVMEEGFQCLDPESGLVIPQKDCEYDLDRLYKPSKSYREIPNEMFGIQYGAGRASGVLAREDVSLAGVSVSNQIVAIANKSEPMGDTMSSGLLGLAYPSITSAHPGNVTDNTTYWANRLPYKPLLFTMYDQGAIKEPYFAHAIARTPQNDTFGFGGYLSLGELPPVKHEDDWAIAPVEIIDEIPLWYTSGRRALSYWALTIPSVSWGEKGNDSTPFQTFLDTGNPNSYFPKRIADAFNAEFDPPAKWDKNNGVYFVRCDAKPPAFALEIAGHIFEHDPADLIYQFGDDTCISSIGNSDAASVGGLTFSILGVPFLKTAVTVCDFGKKEMRFAKLLEEVTNGTTSKGSGNGGDDVYPGDGGGRLVPAALYVLTGVLGALAFAL